MSAREDRQTQPPVAVAGLTMLDLRIQVAPDGPDRRREHEALGAQPFAEGVVHYLVARTETGSRPMTIAEIELQGWSVKEAWSSAWSLTRMLERPTHLSVLDTGRGDVSLLFSAHGFGASFVPFLDDVLPGDDRMTEYGAIVAMPVRHCVLVHAIHGGNVIDAVQTMIPITRQVNRTGPTPVSAHLYWWQGGHLTWIPTYYGGETIEFYPPADLADLIDSIDDVI